MEIDETKIPEGLLVVNEDGTKTLDYSKIKTTDDVENMRNSKQHVKNQLKALKEKYADLDLDKYNSLLNQELEANKDVLSNPVYKNLETKFQNLNDSYNQLKAEILQRDQQLINAELKDQIRNFKGIELSAIDDLMYRVTSSGFAKTEKGFLNKAGENVETFLDSLKGTAPHLFKRTISLQNNERSQNLLNASKNNNLREALRNCPKIN